MRHTVGPAAAAAAAAAGVGTGGGAKMAPPQECKPWRAACRQAEAFLDCWCLHCVPYTQARSGCSPASRGCYWLSGKGLLQQRAGRSPTLGCKLWRAACMQARVPLCSWCLHDVHTAVGWPVCLCLVGVTGCRAKVCCWCSEQAGGRRERLAHVRGYGGGFRCNKAQAQSKGPTGPCGAWTLS